jgi:uncharacterized protein (TIGR00369 family)
MTTLPPRAEGLSFPARVPFVDSLGITLHGFGDGRSELRCDLTERHLNTWDVAHGGVVMTMLDVAMAMAARSGHASGQGVATIEMKTSFMRPAEGQLRALGTLMHATSTMAFCSAELFDDSGKLCASASGTFKYLRALPSRSGLKTQTPTASTPPAHPTPKDSTP